MGRQKRGLTSGEDFREFFITCEFRILVQHRDMATPLEENDEDGLVDEEFCGFLVTGELRIWPYTVRGPRHLINNDGYLLVKEDFCEFLVSGEFRHLMTRSHH